jgi:glycosyltransferase involved in cell wall biosynthesis
MIWILHPTGNTFVRALLSAVTRSGRRFRFFTTIGLAESSRWPRLLPERLRAELLRRSYPIPPSRLATRPGLELARLLALKLGWRALLRHETGLFCVDAVSRDLDAFAGRRLRATAKALQPETVYAYEDAAFEVFKAAGDRCVRKVYELPIAYWETSRRLLDEEASRRPDWEPTLGATRDSPAKCARKTAELEMADAVVCPSQFVFGSLPESAREKKKCVIVPFGSPAGDRNPDARSEASGRRLRFLFAGSMTQRKGLADLFEAVKLLGGRNFELVVMGSLVAPMSFYREKLRDFAYEPPRPHPEVMRLMAGCDVLVLPSIVEGRALVQQEALGNGLPLIVTANAGGEDLIDEGDTGFLIPIRSPVAIAEKMAWFLDHPGELGRMREAARRKAASRSWSDYGTRILSLIDLMP